MTAELPPLQPSSVLSRFFFLGLAFLLSVSVSEHKVETPITARACRCRSSARSELSPPPPPAKGREASRRASGGAKLLWALLGVQTATGLVMLMSVTEKNVALLRYIPFTMNPGVGRCILTAFKEEFKQEIRLVVAETVREVVPETVRELMSQIKEELQHMNYRLPKPMERGPSRPIEGGHSRKLRLHFRTPLPSLVYTGKHIEGEEGAPLEIALIDSNTGNVVEVGPEASIKLDVVVLEGDFLKDDIDDWTGEEFEKYQMREREGKAPLLIGDLEVILKQGLGVLGKLKFTDNSSWNRSKMYQIGLKVASGCCESIRIREAITKPFRVKEKKGESYEKHYPAKPDDEVWRLKTIAKDGRYHKRLTKASIFVVEDLLRQFVGDPKSLRIMLGAGMTDNKWHELMDHAKSCAQSKSFYVYSYDELKSRAVVFDIIGQLKGFVADGTFYSADSLWDEKKEQLINHVRSAYNNWDNVKEFNCRNYSVQNSLPGTSPAGAFWSQPDSSGLSRCHLTRFGAQPSSEIPPGSSRMAVEGYNEPEVGGSLINIHDGSPSVAVQNRRMHSLNQVEVPVHDNSAPAEPQPAASTSHGCSTSYLYFPEVRDSVEKMPSASLQDDAEPGDLMFDSDSESFLRSVFLDDPILPPRSAAVGSWLRIKAVLKWGFFCRQVTNKVRRPTLEQLN